MGSRSYEGTAIHLDDRTLTHLEIGIINKLRRGESFLVSWRDSPDIGDGRISVWMHPALLLYFKFEGGKVPAINKQWLDALADSADGPRGLVVTSEGGEKQALGSGPEVRAKDTAAIPADDPASVTAPPEFRD